MPDIDTDFDDECRRLLSDICYFDGLRSDRCISAHGLEPRTPYLDKEVVQTWLSIPTQLRRGPLEKEILRSAFRGYLPPEIIDRRKEAFSDGMSANAPWRLIHNETEYYKDEFLRYYSLDLIPYKWMPKWSPETSDPSARTLSIYAKQEDSKEEALYSIF
jgi:asparagine synthase (glutamine-hydrolysing)